MKRGDVVRRERRRPFADLGRIARGGNSNGAERTRSSDMLDMSWDMLSDALAVSAGEMSAETLSDFTTWAAAAMMARPCKIRGGRRRHSSRRRVLHQLGVGLAQIP